MSDVNSLFKKKGKSKKLDLAAATAPKKATKTKAEKQKQAAEDDEWKTETKKAVVLTNGKAVAEFGKKYTEEVVYDEDLDMGTKIDMDDTRKLLQDAIKRSTEVSTAAPEEKKEEVKPVPVVDVKSLSLEDRFARASSSKYMARGGGGGLKSAGPKKSLEEEYPTLGVSVTKTAPAPVAKKAPRNAKPKEEEAVDTVSPETVFRATAEATEVQVQVQADAIVTAEVATTPPVTQSAPTPAAVTTPVVVAADTLTTTTSSSVPVEAAVTAEEVVVKKDVKKKKKKGGAFEI